MKRKTPAGRRCHDNGYLKTKGPSFSKDGPFIEQDITLPMADRIAARLAEPGARLPQCPIFVIS
jgi:hypothetical protein